ncbi:MAG TPA: hypothetical protein DIC64_03445 [Alphaproteobacteria bacterium]|nr:hypothetical protein [Alphaproteobacteria bacterium]
MRKNIFAKYILATAFALTPLSVYATANCEAVPNCAEIGFSYSAEQCAGVEKLKCPFGDYYFCSLPENAPADSCDNAHGLYSVCPSGAYCPDSEKVSGCFVPTGCWTQLGYDTEDSKPINQSCVQHSFIANYTDQTNCYMCNIVCNAADGDYYTGGTECTNPVPHSVCSVASNHCYHRTHCLVGYCAARDNEEVSACYQSVGCADGTTGYRAHASRVVSGDILCGVRKNTGDCNVDRYYYSNCSCATGYATDSSFVSSSGLLPRLDGEDDTSCICHKIETINVFVPKASFIPTGLLVDGGSAGDQIGSYPSCSTDNINFDPTITVEACVSKTKCGQATFKCSEANNTPIIIPNQGNITKLTVTFVGSKRTFTSTVDSGALFLRVYDDNPTYE